MLSAEKLPKPHELERVTPTDGLEGHLIVASGQRKPTKLAAVIDVLWRSLHLNGRSLPSMIARSRSSPTNGIHFASTKSSEEILRDSESNPNGRPTNGKPDSGVIAVVRDRAGFLVIRRSMTVKAPGAFCFPGGGIEPGETEPQALCREMREELNVEISIGSRVWQNETPDGISLAWYHVELESDAVLLPNSAEVASVHFIPAASLRYLPGLLCTNTGFLQALELGLVTLPSPS